MSAPIRKHKRIRVDDEEDQSRETLPIHKRKKIQAEYKKNEPALIRKRKQIRVDDEDEKETEEEYRPKEENPAPPQVEQNDDEFEFDVEAIKAAKLDRVFRSLRAGGEGRWIAGTDTRDSYNPRAMQHIAESVSGNIDKSVAHDKKTKLLQKELGALVETCARNWGIVPDVWIKLMTYLDGLGWSKDLNLGALCAIILTYFPTHYEEDDEENLQAMIEQRDAYEEKVYDDDDDDTHIRITHSARHQFADKEKRLLAAVLVDTVSNGHRLLELTLELIACNKLKRKMVESARAAAAWMRA